MAPTKIVVVPLCFCCGGLCKVPIEIYIYLIEVAFTRDIDVPLQKRSLRLAIMTHILRTALPINIYHVAAIVIFSCSNQCNQTEAGRRIGLVPFCTVNNNIHFCCYIQGTLPRWWQRNKGLLPKSMKSSSQ